jgi:hypothetical protein
MYWVFRNRDRKMHEYISSLSSKKLKKMFSTTSLIGKYVADEATHFPKSTRILS